MKPTVNAYDVLFEKVSYRPSTLMAEPVLNGINIKILAGQFVAVVGANGAGKSSFLASVAGEVGQIEGNVRIGGTRITRPVNRVIDGVGVVHQDDKTDLIPHLSIAQNINIRQLLGTGKGTSVFTLEGAWHRKIAATLATYAPTLDPEKIVGFLSGGERQILSILIAMRLEHEHNPCRLILLDEHTAKLDHTNADWVMSFTVNQIIQTKCTAIMVTHRYADAIKHADRILVFGKGQIKAAFDFDRSVFEHETTDWLLKKVDEADQ